MGLSDLFGESRAIRSAAGRGKRTRRNRVGWQICRLEPRRLLSAAPVGDLTEGNAAAWVGFASDNQATYLTDDSSRVRAGQQSLHFVTESGFDTGVRLPAGTDDWDLTSVNLLEFWIYGQNQTPIGWQGNQPQIVLTSAAGELTLTPQIQVMPNGVWSKIVVPLAGDTIWQAVTNGQFDRTHVSGLEFHQDTWDYGFEVYYDGVRFTDRDIETLPPAGPAAPAGVNQDAISPKVLLYVFDPIMENLGGQRQHAAYGWEDPLNLAAGVVAAFENNSHHLVHYQLETLVADAHPYFTDGFQHTDTSFVTAWDARDFHAGAQFDYVRFAEENNIAQRIDAGEIDEVWIYTGPISGTWESTMGGTGAYYINGPTQPIPSQRAFPIMGLNFERGVAEAIHSFGHRLESTMDHIYGPQGNHLDTNWDKFTFQDRYQTGLGGVGNVHFPVNGTSDYDYGNTTLVVSNADDWYNYPNFQGITRQVNVGDWTVNTDDAQLGYLNWWYDHLPHFSGRGPDYRLNNWWRYFTDVNQFKGGPFSLAYTEGQPVVHASVPTSVSGVVDLVADAFVDGALGRVDFYVDGTYQQTDTLAPYTFQWDTTVIATGQHSVEFRAYDLQNGTEGKSAANLTFVNSAAVPSVNLVSAAQTVSESGGSVTITVNLSSPAAEAVSIPFSLTGTALSPSDFTGGNSPLTIFQGMTSGTITLSVIDDELLEANETITITLLSPSNVVLGATTTHTVTILDNDGNNPPTIEDQSRSISEGATTGSPVGAPLVASDPDAGQSLIYSILSGNVGNTFVIDPLTGQISVASVQALDFESRPVFQLTVQVSDDGAPERSDTATVTITVLNALVEPVLLNIGGTTTYVRSTPPVTLLPDAMASVFSEGPGIGRVVIDFFVPKKGSLTDVRLGDVSSLGTVTHSGVQDFRKSGGVHTLTIDLNEGVTPAQVQAFLRNISFSTRNFDTPKKPLGRSLSVQLFSRGSAIQASARLTMQINALKKLPK